METDETTVPSLTPEVLYLVFGFLDRSSLCMCSVVCIQWRSLAYMGSLWNQLDMRNRSNVSDAISALQLTGRTEKLVRVDMSDTDLQDQGLELLLRNSPAVTELNLTCCKQLTEDVVRVFEAYPCRIQTLLIAGCRRIPLRRLKGLAELNELHAFECDLLSANKTEFATIRRNSMFLFLPLIPTRTNLQLLAP